MGLDYYDILCLKRDCSPSEIARAYRTLSLKWHPKLSKEDPNTSIYHFSQISESYEVLSCPTKRAFFDKHGEKFLKEGFFSDGVIHGGYQFGGNPEEIFTRFFEQNNPFAKIYDADGREKLGSLFGYSFGAQNFKGLPPIPDLYVNVECTLNELYSGCMKEANFLRTVLNNDGRTTREEHVVKVVDIKPGYEDGTKIILKEQGNESNGKKTSDLILIVRQKKHSEFERKGNDLIYTARITLLQALLSETVRVNTLDGRKLLLPMDEIIGPKTLKRIEGEGMPVNDQDKRGNLLIRFDIVFPQNIEEEVKQEVISLLKNSE